MTLSIEDIQVNIPFSMLYEGYLDRFITLKLNPEIGFDALALSRYPLSDISGIAERLFECGLSITLHAPFVDLSPGSPDPEVWTLTRRRFEQVLQLLPVLKPKTLVCHAGYDEKRYGYLRESWIEKSLEMWTWLGGRVQDGGALLMLENVYEQGPEDIRVIFEGLDRQKVGFCLDTGHQAAFGRAPLEIWLESLGPYLGQIHLHDNSSKKDEHLAMGRGTIDFGTFFQMLKAMKKEPPVITLEPHKEEDLMPSFEYLKEIWPW